MGLHGYQNSFLLHAGFRAGVLIKGIDGILELIGGALLLFFKPETINYLITVVTRYELSEDSNDAVANWLLNFSESLSIGKTHFAAAYLIAHGVIKIFLVYGLLRDKQWAFPTGIGLLSLFVCYQCYRMTFAYSPLLLILTIVDVFVIMLIYQEFRHRSKHQKSAP